MATAYINYLEVISLKPLQTGGASDASCSSSGYQEKIMIWLMQKILLVIYMFLACGLHIF
jgi:hypothetical protein